MSLDFVGMDPDSPDTKCPAAYVHPDSGDFYFQGKTVTDPMALAEIAKHSPLGADESVVRLPARMASIIGEAASGTYESGRIGHGQVDLMDLFAGVRHSAVHLEMRDTYDAKHPGFQDWLAGGSGRYDRSAWLDVVASVVRRGAKIRRARVVSEPITDYIRWEHMLTGENQDAGEEVRWLPRQQAFNLMMPGSDFWMFDGRVVAFNFCAGDGTDTEEEIFTNDPDVVTRCIAAFEQVWERATPHEDYRPR